MAMKLNRTIVTTNICPPIPVRQFDWCAHYDGEEEAGNYGYGSTAAEAIQDFKDNFAADHDERLDGKSPNPLLQGEWKAHVGWAGSVMDNAETLRMHPNWCEVTGPNGLSINGHFGIEVARVIAAAPDMLAAAKEMLEAMPADTLITDDELSSIAKLRAAIAKAEGRS